MEISSSKDLVLELGGKDAAILLDDHNLENIAKDIVAGHLVILDKDVQQLKGLLLQMI